MLSHISFFSPQVDKWKMSKDDNIKFSPRIAHFLLHWFKEFHQEQMLEKSAEASIQGIIIIVVIIAVSVFR
jgi:hypothetical protein